LQPDWATFLRNNQRRTHKLHAAAMAAGRLSERKPAEFGSDLPKIMVIEE